MTGAHGVGAVRGEESREGLVPGDKWDWDQDRRSPALSAGCGQDQRGRRASQQPYSSGRCRHRPPFQHGPVPARRGFGTSPGPSGSSRRAAGEEVRGAEAGGGDRDRDRDRAAAGGRADPPDGGRPRFAAARPAPPARRHEPQQRQQRARKGGHSPAVG